MDGQLVSQLHSPHKTPNPVLLGSIKKHHHQYKAAMLHARASEKVLGELSGP